MHFKVLWLGKVKSHAGDMRLDRIMAPEVLCKIGTLKSIGDMS
jgi:hypothetical protein